MTETKPPQPGSDAAVAAGCKCPVMDNARGRGAWGSSGADAFYWVSGDCPLHDPVQAAKRRINAD